MELSLEQYLQLPFKKALPPFVLAGFTVTILYSAVWIVAAALDGKWIFGINALSDLGACNTPASVILFNYGCVLTGFSGCWFGYGIMKYEKGPLYLAGLFTCIGTLFLMGVGAIPETFGTPHMFCAATFGLMAVLAMISSSIGDFLKGRWQYALSSVILVLIVIIVSVSMSMMGQRFGLYEAIDIICVLIWVGIQSYKYYKIIGFIELPDPIKIIFENDNAPKGRN